jgi:formiminotetrahydrofolate cyclodeaminase
MPPTPFADMSLRQFLEATGAQSPTPGGGAVASAVGALSASLAQMVVNYSVGKKSLAEHQPALSAAVTAMGRVRDVMLELAEEDAAAYGLVNELTRLSEGDARKERELPAAAAASVQVPMAVAAAGVDLLLRFEGLVKITNPQLKSDLAIAAILAEAAVRASGCNVAVNAPLMPDASERNKTRAEMVKMENDARKWCARVCAACG